MDTEPLRLLEWAA